MRLSHILLPIAVGLQAIALPAHGQSPAGASPETGTTQASVGTEEFRVVDADGEFQLHWGEHILLRELALKHKGEDLDFSPELVELKQNGRQLTLIPSNPEIAEGIKLFATFSLSFSPIVRRYNSSDDGIFQFAQGRIASNRCDLLIAPKLGLGLALRPSDLDLTFWKEGGTAEVKIGLDDHPVLKVVDLPKEPEADDSLSSLRVELIKRFADDKGNLPAILDQLFVPIRKKLPSIRSLDSQAPIWAETQLVNFRVGQGDEYPPFDVLLFLNSSQNPRTMVANFRDLGWDKAKARRFAVDYPTGDCQAGIKNSLSVDVPANDWKVVLLRPYMPRGIVATSDGPLSALINPWAWDGSGSAKSGKKAFLVTYRGPGHSAPGGWMVYSSANGRDEPYGIISAQMADETEVTYQQEGAWARIDYPACDADWQILQMIIGEM